MYYSATYPNAKLKFRANVILSWTQIDTSDLSKTKARYRAGGFSYLSTKPSFPIQPIAPSPPLFGAIIVNSKIIDVVKSSAKEHENPGCKKSNAYNNGVIFIFRKRSPSGVQIWLKAKNSLEIDIISWNEMMIHIHEIMIHRNLLKVSFLSILSNLRKNNRWIHHLRVQLLVIHIQI